jgi:hypothetical protein
MDRRKFLTSAATAGGLCVLGGGFWARQAYARGQLRQELLRHATPLLTAKAHEELQALPERAREDMRKYFHGVCLNVSGFVDEVTSPAFRAKLDDAAGHGEEHALLLDVFQRRVTTETQTLERVRAEAEEISADLDRNWADCCRRLAEEWGVSVTDYRITLSAADLLDRMTPTVQSGIRQALEAAQRGGRRVMLTDAADAVGKSALLLLQVEVTHPWAGWPQFAVATFMRPLFEFLLFKLRDRGAALQQAVSERLAYLANRVGAEFRDQIKLRIADLHRWQHQAVEAAVADQAQELIPSLI